MDKVSQPIDKGLLAETNILILKHPSLEIVFYISVTTSVVWLGDWELFYDVRHGTLPGDLFITKFSLVGLMVQLSRSHILSKRMLKLPTSRDVNYKDMKENLMHFWASPAVFILVLSHCCNPSPQTGRYWDGEKAILEYCTWPVLSSHSAMITRSW